MDGLPQVRSRLPPPGFSQARLAALMQRAVAETELDLSGLTVLTEAATGAYGVTPAIAALAGATRVHAFCRASRYGSIAEVSDWTLELAEALGVSERISIIDAIPSGLLGQVDILTNSGHLRPLNAAMVEGLPDTAVIALMFEAWEFRASDIDLEACTMRGIPVVGVNEQHASVDVFSFLGPLAVKELHDCGLAVYRNKIALACDNAFAPSIERALSALGGDVAVFSQIGDIRAAAWDAIVIALRPERAPRVGQNEVRHLATVLPPKAVVVQFWGDVDRDAVQMAHLPIWPVQPPAPGHMAILLSAIGPEPIVRLQAGGLRAAEWVRRGRHASPGSIAQLVQPA